MRHLTVALLTLFCAVGLAACGDTGDHFLEFRPAPSPPAVVHHVVLAMPVIASKSTQHASLKLYVTAYTNKGAIAQGTTLANPITIHSNWTGLTMLVKGKQVTAAAFGSAPATLAVTYNAPASPCKPPVAFVAFNQNAIPQTVVLDAVKC